MGDGTSQPEPKNETDADRAARWIRFYDELIAYEESVLSAMQELSAEMPEEEREMVLRTNVEPLQELVADFRRRRQLWLRGGSGE